MFSFLIELRSTENLYTVPFNEIPLCSSIAKFVIGFLNKNYTDFCLKFVNLCVIYIQVTLITIVM